MKLAFFDHVHSHITLPHVVKNRSGELAYFVVLHSVFWALIGTFEVALIYKLTGSFAIYFITDYIHKLVIFLTFLIIPHFAPKVNMFYIFKLSTLYQIFLCGFLMYFYPHLANLWILAIYAVFKGIWGGLFWFGNHMTTLLVVKDNDRDGYGLSLQAAQILIPVFVPLFGAFIISEFPNVLMTSSTNISSGYFGLFFAGLVLSILTLAFAPHFHVVKEFRFSYLKVFKLIKSPRVQLLRTAMTLDCLQSELLIASALILSYIILGSEVNLALYISSIHIIAAVYYVYLKKFKAQKNIDRQRLFQFGVSGDIASRLLFVFNNNIYGLLVKASVDTFLVPLKNIFGGNSIKHHLERTSRQFKISREELIVFQELCHICVRTTTISLVILFAFVLKVDLELLCKTFIVLSSILAFINYFNVKKINKIE